MLDLSASCLVAGFAQLFVSPWQPTALCGVIVLMIVTCALRANKGRASVGMNKAGEAADRSAFRCPPLHSLVPKAVLRTLNNARAYWSPQACLGAICPQIPLCTDKIEAMTQAYIQSKWWRFYG